MAYKIEYKSSVFRDLKNMDKHIAQRITRDLRESLSIDPNCGEPLTGQFKGLMKLRVGEFRVIYCRTAEGVLTLRIGHRSSVYSR